MIKKELQQELNRTKVVLDYARQEIKEKDKEIERLNNDIKVLLKENSNKEKVIKTQDNIINELEKWLDKKEKLTFNSWNKGIHEVQRKLQELKGSDKE